MKLKDRIRKEMLITTKDMDIKELVEMKVWTEEEIRKRWKQLEEEVVRT